MLTLFRDLIRSKVALVLIGLLILSLALFGVPDFFGSIMGKNLGSSLMRVDSRTLEVSDVERYAQRIVDVDRNQEGNLTRQKLADTGQLDDIINLLSDNQIRAAYIDKLGVNAAKREGADWVRNVSGIRDDITGEFDPVLYAQFVEQQGFDRETTFERVLLDDISFTNVREGLKAGLSPTNGMADLWSVFQAEARNFAYFTFDVDDLPEPVVAPTKDEVLNFYNERQDILQSPERRQFSVIAVRPEDFFHKVTVEDEDVRTQFQAQIKRFSGPSERTFTLVVYPDATKAQTALGRLLGGETPEMVGGVVLEDQAAIEGESTDTAFEKRLFSAPPGSWVGVITLQNGQSAVFQVTSEKPGEPKPFESVKDEIEQELINSRAKRMFDRVINDIDDSVGAGLPLVEMAGILGSPVYTYPPIDNRGRTEDGLFVRNLAALEGAIPYGFQLFPGETSDRRDGENVHFVIRLDRVIDPFVPPLEDIETELTEALFLNKQSEAQADYAESAMERIRSGAATITTEAIALGKDVTRPPVAMTRMSGQSQGYSQAALGQIFNAKLDEPFSAPLQRGSFIGVVEDIRIPEESELVSLRNASVAEIAPLLGQELENSFTVIAQKHVNIDLNPAQIDAYLQTYKSDE